MIAREIYRYEMGEGGGACGCSGGRIHVYARYANGFLITCCRFTRLLPACTHRCSDYMRWIHGYIYYTNGCSDYILVHFFVFFFFSFRHRRVRWSAYSPDSYSLHERTKELHVVRISYYMLDMILILVYWLRFFRLYKPVSPTNLEPHSSIGFISIFILVGNFSYSRTRRRDKL